LIISIQFNLKRENSMARLKIDDLPRDLEISQKELRKVVGGRMLSPGDLKLTANHFVSCDLVMVMTPSGPSLQPLYAVV
jgi:hypothetical protein